MYYVRMKKNVIKVKREGRKEDRIGRGDWNDR